MRTSLKYKHLALVAAATIVLLLPFLDKAFHIDDPLFLWTAKQILMEPRDFYGFTGNWFGQAEPAYVFIKNPPLASYYIALIAYFTGFSEAALHAAFIVPAVIAAVGTYVLASRLTGRPLMAALAAVATPGFLVSSTTLMCDVMMLAFWLWAIVLWMKGLDGGGPVYLAFGALFVAMSFLTKYFGMSLIPLLALYTLLKQGKGGFKYLLFLLIPLAVIAGYQLYTQHMYGRGLLLDAADYASGAREIINSGVFEKSMVGISFFGGCAVAVLFFLVSVWGRHGAIIGVVFAVAGALYAYWKGGTEGFEIFSPFHRLEYVDGAGWANTVSHPGNAGSAYANPAWKYIVHLAIYVSAGLSIFALAVNDIVKRRSAESVLLALWVAGTFVFAVYLNWTINARSVLPMMPAAAILLMRAADEVRPGAARLWVPLALSAAISLSVAWADYRQANGLRSAAHMISSAQDNAGKTFWFRGHWGFKYYMEEAGARHLVSGSRRSPGDIIVVPGNTDGKRLSGEFQMIDSIGLPRQAINIMNSYCGAGFYSSIWGPLPYVLDPDCKETYYFLFVKN